MRSGVYDVTLYWHDGGSLFLGTVAAMSRAEAQALALRQYQGQGEAARQEIGEGGGYQLDAELLPEEQAAEWRSNR